ncbi:hypothetical protein BJV93_001087 [Clostridium butyricum]|nr:hypothetical protein [Clostridium butyricum]
MPFSRRAVVFSNASLVGFPVLEYSYLAAYKLMSGK